MARKEAEAFDFDISTHPVLPKVDGLFVVGCDVGVGRTLVAGAIARALRRRGRPVEVFKPVATRCRRRAEGLVSAETAFLAACADSQRALAEISPLRYRSSLPPDLAGEGEDRPVSLEAIFQAYRQLAGCGKAVVVEAPGGLLGPISEKFWTIHLARMMNLPLVVVSRPGEAGVDLAMLTLHAARTGGLRVAGVVLNGYAVEPGDSTVMAAGGELGAGREEDLEIGANILAITRRAGVEVLAVVPTESANNIDQATLGPDTQFAIDQVDWERFLTDSWR